MAVFYRFDPTDIVHYSLGTTPKVVLASGTAGWRSNTGENGEISMYGGIRSKETDASSGLTIQPTYLLNTFSIDGKIAVSSSYPYTGSVSYVQCINREIDRNDQQHDGFWGQEHFSPILNLYDYYNRYGPDYTTGSYDYYSLYSQGGGAGNKVTYSGSLEQLTTSYTFEAVIKPLSIKGSAEDYTIISRTSQWSLYIASGGKLAFSASDGSGQIRTSSIAVTNNRWQHVAYRVGNGTGSFHIDMVDAGVQTDVTGTLDFVDPAFNAVNVAFNQSSVEDIFHGFIFEVKAWEGRRSFVELSSSFDRTLQNSGSESLKLYSRFNDGPRSTYHAKTRGSGAFNYSTASGFTVHGLLQNFDDRNAPVWHPNDNADFITTKNLIPHSIDEFRIVHVPSLYYGRAIQTGSVRLTCNSFLSSSLMRTLVDDGRGGLYLSGSASSSSLDEREEYVGVAWPKVGNVFYSEGLIVIKDPALLDFGQTNPDSPLQDDLLQVSFQGQQSIPSNVFMCRVNGAKANASNNPSFTTYDSGSDKFRVIRDEPTTYITAVGLYDKRRKLVGVAKLAQPIRNREIDKLNIRLKLDF
jgi:hypothetical protein